MSTHLLYHTQNIIGYTCDRIFYENGGVFLRLHPQERQIRCPLCGSQDVPCDIMTLNDVARFLSIPWNTIQEIHKRHLTREYSRPCLKNLRRLAIDKLSVRKGHRYLTVVLNQGTGAVVFVGDGKGSNALAPFWKLLGRRRKKIESVVIDMSPAYTKAIREILSKAKLVYDHFHVVKLYNEKLSGLRRKLYRNTKEVDEKEHLKGTRWLLLKNPENLKVKDDEPSRLEKALSAKPPLMTAYCLKEYLRRFWS